MRQYLHGTYWAQYAFVLLIAINIVLLLVGLLIVPSTLGSADGIGQLFGTLSMQLVLAALALFGPWSFRHMRASIGISFVLGGCFALLYLGDIIVDFRGGADPVNIYAIFIGVALVAGSLAGYHARQWQQGLLAAIWASVIGTVLWSAGIMLINYATWGSHQQYLFWLGDGAINDFQRSGSTDLYAFLLQDLQGALFFHPILSAIVGTICGLLSSGAAQGAVYLKRSFQLVRKQ